MPFLDARRGPSSTRAAKRPSAPQVGFLGYLGHTAAGRAAPRFYPLVVLVCAVYAVLVLALAAEALGGPTAAAGHLDFALMGSTYAALAVLLAVNRHQLLRTLSGAPFPARVGVAGTRVEGRC